MMVTEVNNDQSNNREIERPDPGPAAMRAEMERYEVVMYIHGNRWFVQSKNLREIYYEGETRAACQSFIDERAFAAGQEAMWQPIETAPRDGTAFIGIKGKMVFRTYCSQHYVKWPHEEGGPTFQEVWSREDDSSIFPWKPTHWMPLPSRPEGGE
jgi:hypothetical protein